MTATVVILEVGPRLQLTLLTAILAALVYAWWWFAALRRQP